jgi:uncharacterized protein YggE
MDEKVADRIIRATEYPRRFASVALFMLAIFLFAAAIAEFKSIKYIGSGVTATNTIAVTGTADVFAVPDTAEFSASVIETAADVQTAQAQATAKGNAIIDYLKSAGIDKKDIQTTDYSVNPQYEYRQAGGVCPAGSYCPPGKQVLTGYQVNETFSVKVRDTKKAGDLLSAVGKKGASNVSGLSFTIDDQNALEMQAREKAITDAKAKAKELAKSLGVSLVRIVGFSENGNNVVYPYAAKSMALGATADAAAPPEIATGQNKITSNITLSYEIQ